MSHSILSELNAPQPRQPRRRAAATTGIVLSLVVIGGLAWSAFGWQSRVVATAPDKLLPAKPALLYVWDGFAAHQKTWDATAAQKSLVQSGLTKTVNRLLDFAVTESGEKGAEVAKKLATRLLDSGASVSVSVEKISDQPAPQVTILLHGAADLAPQLLALIEGPLQIVNPKSETIGGRKVMRIAIPEADGYEVGWWTDGGHLVISGGRGAIEAALQVAQGKSPNLTTNTIVQQLRKTKDFDVAAVSFVDIKSLLALAEGLNIPPIPGSDKAPVKVADVLRETGLTNVGMLQGRWGFRGEAIWSEVTLQAPAPRTGIPALFDQKLLTLKDLPPMPKGCDNFSAFQFDVSKFTAAGLAWARLAHDAFAPADTPAVDALLGQFKEHTGFDLVADLLDPLGDTFVGFVDPAASALMPAGAVLVRVDDAEKLLATLAKLEELATALAGENAKFRTKDINGRSLHVIQFSGPVAFFSPSWVVDKGWLVIGSTPQTVEAHLKRVDGKLPAWQAPPEIAEGLKQLPQKFTSFTYSDPRAGLRSLLALAPTGISMAELGMVEWRKVRAASGQKVDDEAEFPISGEDVPLAEDVVGPLFPNLNVSTVDAEGIKWYSRSSLPGAPIPGTGGGVEGVGTVAVLIALLLPAVQQAREAARRAESRNNLKQLGLAMHNHHDTKNGFPAGTHPNAKLKPEERLSWIVELLPYLEESPLYEKVVQEKGWNDKANQPALSPSIPLFLNPSQPSAAVLKGYGVTHYVGIAGLGKDAATLPITDNKVGVFGYDRVTRIADITDGTSNTMMITDGSKDFGPWSQGGASTIRSLTTKPYINGPDGIGSPHTGIVQVLMGDGSVRAISQNVDPKVFEALSTIHGGEEVGDF